MTHLVLNYRGIYKYLIVKILFFFGGWGINFIVITINYECAHFDFKTTIDLMISIFDYYYNYDEFKIQEKHLKLRDDIGQNLFQHLVR